MSEDSGREELREAIQAPREAIGQVNEIDSPLSTPPSTATSTTDTVSTNDENARNCEEWELFADLEDNLRPHSQAPSEIPGSWTERSEASCLLDEKTEENLTANKYEEANDGSREAASQVTMVMCDGLTGTSPQDDESRDSESLSSSPRSERVSGTARFRSALETSSRIQVLVRVRPAARGEPQTDAVTVGDASNIVRVHAMQTGSVIDCAVDRVFLDTATQEEVYTAVEPGVRAALDGVNATIFAYGQTGTGKTHTMFGAETDSDGGNFSSEWGLIPRAFRDIIAQAEHMAEKAIVDLSCSFMQVYNERVFDLLSDPKRQKPLIVREQPSPEGGTAVILQGLSRERIFTLANALELVRKGRANRSMRETELNAASSRSHAIVQVCIIVSTTLPCGDKCIRTSRLNLVDLAGSEKWNTDIEMEERHAAELKNINTSLSALGNCIAALAEPGRRHIPYRDSTLTRLLQDSFGGSTLSFLIATVSPSQKSTEETIRTLQFADRARSVMQVVRVNESFSGSTELLAAKAQIKALRDRLAHEQRRRHETRLKEHEAMQRDFASKLQEKDEEIERLTRDNMVFTKWRTEDVTKIRMLEARLKDVESQLLQRRPQSSGGAAETINDVVPSDVSQEHFYTTLNEDDNQNEATDHQPNECKGHESADKKVLRRKVSVKGIVKGKCGRPEIAQPTDTDTKRSKVKSYRSLLEKYALGTQSRNIRGQDCESKTNINKTKTSPEEQFITGNMRIAETKPSLPEEVHQITRSASESMFPSPVARTYQTSEYSTEASKSLITTQNTGSPQRYALDNTSRTTLAKSDSLPVLPRSNLTHGLPYDSYSSVDQLMFGRTVGQTKTSDDHIMKHAWQLPPVQSTSSLTQDSVGNSLRSDAATVIPQDVCVKHSLKGCVLCAVRDNRPTLVSSSPNRDAMKLTQGPPSSNLSTARLVVDGTRPCDRHQLPGCFLCSKTSSSGLWKSSSSIPIVPSSTLPTTSFSSFISPSTIAEQPQGSRLQCSTHFLANCVLCAGISNRSSVSTESASPMKRIGYEPFIAPSNFPSTSIQHSPSQTYGISVSSSNVPQDKAPNSVFQSSTSSPSPMTRHTLNDHAMDSAARRHFHSLVREASDAANLVLRRR